jgi:hypothetical protein
MADIVAASARHLAPMAFSAVGLGLFPTTIFAQLLPCPSTDTPGLDNNLAGPEADSYEATARWDLSFANLVRFTRPVDPPMVAKMVPLREGKLADVEVRELQIVRTDTFLSAEGIVVLARIPLSG